MDGKKVEGIDIKSKEIIPSSVKFPMLNAANYIVWSMRMKIAPKVNKVWKTIEPGSKNKEKNNMPIVLLFQSIPETLILQVGDLYTSKAVLNAIEARHVGAYRSRHVVSKSAALWETVDKLKILIFFFLKVYREEIKIHTYCCKSWASPWSQYN